MQLVIVESPTKARKLKSYLGSEYIVEASVGHVQDLPKNETGIDVGHDFQPTYVVSPDKKKVISQLKKYAHDAELIILATDPDREGEAIAWHVQTILAAGKGKDKIAAPSVRATFHEITKTAVLEALAQPSELNMALVNAQQARRVVDRLVGYEVSPVLWRKVRRGLSAGRVQSVALRLIVDREREIEAFIPVEYWEVDVALSLDTAKIKAALFTQGKVADVVPDGVLVARVFSLDGQKYVPTQESHVTPIVAWLPTAAYTVASVEKKERSIVSLPPFTTSTLQQSAANRLGFTSKQTMTLAQQLYEEGLITYHRTDSVNLSSQSIDQSRSYIAQTYGKEYVPEKPRYFANKSKNAQEAHEAIRVTEVGRQSVLEVAARLTDRHQKLYDLIRRRHLACQMSAAVFDQATIVVDAVQAQNKAQLRTTGSVLKFDGWKKLFPVQEDVVLPSVTPQQPLHYQDLNAAQKFTQPPARYNDASLVKELEKRGIGRPSTYASIISVIIDRGYAERVEKRFLPSSIGMAVCDFLLLNFRTFMEYDFTAEMEEDLDRIARGEKEWVGVVRAFYTPFHQTVEKALADAERVKLPVEKTGETCPLCGETDGGEIVIRTGKYGKFLSCSRFPDCKYTKNIVDVVAGVMCPLCQQGEVIARKSRWGKPFFGCGRYPECNWASWKKPEPGSIVTPEEWAEQQAKREERKAAKAEKIGKGAIKASRKKKPIKKKPSLKNKKTK